MLSRMRGSRAALLLAAAAVLMLVVVVTRGQSAVPSSMADPGIERGLPFLSSSGASSPTEGPRFADVDPGLAFKIVAGLIVVMLFLAIVLSALAALRRRMFDRRLVIAPPAEAADGTVDTVLRLKGAVQEARDLLARPGGKPTDAVIQAWLMLENAAEHGRAPHQTATEFTVSLLAKETADEAAVTELRTLYHRARFGTGGGEGDASAAHEALNRILATI
jgi:Domain of unknown function (DUF4129)